MKKGSEIVKRYAPPIPMLVDFHDMTIYVAKKGAALSERTMQQFIPVRMSLQTPNSARPVINLKADTKFQGSGTTLDPYTVVS